MLISLQAYVPALVRKWWAVIGLAAGILGYIVDLLTNLKVPPVVWISIFVLGVGAHEIWTDTTTKSEQSWR